MEPTEIMDLAMRVYQTFGLTMLRATAIPAIFCFASLVFVTEYIVPSFFTTRHAESTPAQVGEAGANLLLGFGVGGPLFLIGVSYASGVIVHLVADFIGGRPANEAGANAGARRLLGRLLLLNVRELFQAWSGVVIAFIALAAGSLLSDVLPDENLWPAVASLVAVLGFLFGGVAIPIVLSRHCLAPSAMVLEGERVRGAIRRSVELMKGSPWGPSGYGVTMLLFLAELLILLLIWVGASLSLGMLDALNQARALEGIPWIGVGLRAVLDYFPLFLAVWITIPVWCTTTTLLYYERRIRLEGYDIVSLAQEVWRTDRQSRFEL